MSGRDTWYRSQVWTDVIAAEFQARLARKRDKHQYLRIQAQYLVQCHPRVALELLGQYFDMPVNFDQALAHVARAEALLSLNQVDEAIVAYEAALAREQDFPSFGTRAHLDLPYLIAMRRIASHYKRALEVLDTRKGTLVFPIDQFMWHGSRAIVLYAMGDLASARENAAAALDAAAMETSGLRYHPQLGLVGEHESDAMRRLSEICAA